MLRFFNHRKALEWVNKFASGDVCVISGGNTDVYQRSGTVVGPCSARLQFNHSGVGFIPGDMRVLQVEVAVGVWE